MDNKELLKLALSLVAKYGIENIDLAVELGKVVNEQEPTQPEAQPAQLENQPAQNEVK